MSSHHIVRDNQEPALLILEAGSASYEVIQELLEWSPSVIVQESQLDLVLSWGIKIDIVLLQKDHEQEITAKIVDQWPVKLIFYSLEELPIDRGIAFLTAGNYPSVNIVTQQTHLLQQILFHPGKIDIVVIESGIRWSLIRTDQYEKKAADGASFFVLDKNQERKAVLLSEGKVHIAQAGPFWVGEKL